MKKSLLSGLLLASSFFLFNSHSSAEELSKSIVEPIESTEDIIYFNSDKQDLLVTDDIIIRTVEPNNSLLKAVDVQATSNGVWDLLGYETVYSTSSIWHSTGGDFAVEVGQTDFGPVFYQLKESDGSTSQNVGSKLSVSGSKIVTLTYRGISNYVDGDNELAEFYMKKLTHTSKGFIMAFYD